MEYPEGFDATVMRNKPICGVLAVAICAGVSYPVAFAACKRNMPAHRQRMRGSTHPSQREAALRELAVKFTDLTRHYRDFSVMSFCAGFADDDNTYMLKVRKHVLTLKGGFLIDQQRCIPWQNYTHPRIKLKGVLRIDGKGW